ncbi:MAG: DUF362 domain-containing protein [Candidatus Hodarchaeales archaeon]
MDEIFYLPRDNTVTISIEKELEQLGSMVLPSQILDYLIDQTEKIWIMDWCICRSASKCEGYPIDLGCMFMGDAALKISPKLGHIATKEEAKVHAKRAREAGLVHLIGRNKLDTIWLGVGPGKKLLTTCFCCECCCLWRILPKVSDKIAKKVTKMPGVMVEVQEEMCIGCGTCSGKSKVTNKPICFVEAISMEDEKAVIDQEMCRGCGRCAEVCPEEAITVTMENIEEIANLAHHITTLVEIT